jgi:hypothetical protein
MKRHLWVDYHAIHFQTSEKKEQHSWVRVTVKALIVFWIWKQVKGDWEYETFGVVEIKSVPNRVWCFSVFHYETQ